MKSKKSIAILLTILLLFIASATLFACNDGSTPGGDYSILPDDSGKNEVSFTATFIYSDGSTQPYSVTGLTAGSKISLNSATRNPKREGYEFAGWYTEDALINAWNFDKDIVTSNTTLYAKWNLSYPVYIAGEAFSYDAAKKSVRYNVGADVQELNLTDSVVLANDSYRYCFYLNAECTDEAQNWDTAKFTLNPGENKYYLRITDSSKKVLHVLEFVIYKKQIYAVEFYNKDGLLIETVRVEENTGLGRVAEYIIPGYVTLWQDEEGNTWRNGDSVTGNVKLYAVLVQMLYEVTLNPGGGAIEQSSVKLVYAESFSLPIPTKAGSNFVGWYKENGEQVTGSNGISLTIWDVPKSTTLVAKWADTAYSVNKYVKIDNEATFAEERKITSDQKCVFETSEKEVEYYDAKCVVYAFLGWFDMRGEKISSERTLTISDVNRNTDIYETWKKVVITHNLEKSDAKITFIDTKFAKYGNFDATDKIQIKVECTCGKHTFAGWTDGSTSPVYLLSVDSAPVAQWNAYNVNVKVVIDGASVTDENALFDGAGAVTVGKNVRLEAYDNEKYTFAGWYINNGTEFILATEKPDFIYEFTMTAEDKEVECRWHTTTKLILTQTSTLGSYATPKLESNIVGAEFGFDKTISAGYTFIGIYVGSILQKETLYVPAQPTTYSARFVSGLFKVRTNITDAGGVDYRVNSGRTITGSSYGGDVIMIGNSVNDKISLSAKTNNGYVWLGWFDEGGNCHSTDAEFLSTVPSETRVSIIAKWKKVNHLATVKAGIFTATKVQTGKFVPANTYYVYDEDGEYSLTTDLYFDGYKKYYTYVTGVTGAGEQTVTSSFNITGDSYFILSTEINSNYRFDGWYDNKGNRISLSTETRVSMGEECDDYTARFTYLGDDYDIKVSKYLQNKGFAAGDIKLVAYREINADGTIVEKADVIVDTQKTSYNGAKSTGYLFYRLALVKEGKDVNTLIDWSTVLNSDNDVIGYEDFGKIAVKKVSDDYFTTTYTFNVTAMRKEGTKKEYVAIWQDEYDGGGKQYVLPFVVANSDDSKGDVYYTAQKEGGVQVYVYLAAEAKPGYTFKYWEDKNGERKTDAALRLSNASGQKYTAYWGEIGEYSITADVDGGDYSITGYERNGIKTLEFSAKTKNGYSFLGWYADDVLAIADDNFTIEVNLETGVSSLFLPNRDRPITGFTATDFEIKWKKIDVLPTVESVGEVEIRGYYKTLITETGTALEPMYELRVKTNDYFETDVGGEKVLYGDYGGYIFNGWFDENGELLSDSLVFVIPVAQADSKYKAKWSKPEVEVSVTSKGTTNGSYAKYYVKKIFNENGQHEGYVLTLQAFVAANEIFTGWSNASDDATVSYAKNYSVTLDKSISKAEYTARFEAIRPTVSIEVLGGSESDLKPFVTAYKQSSRIYKYELNANVPNGYQFIGWQKRDDDNTNLALGSDVVYVVESEGMLPESSFIAMYQPLTSENCFPNFGLDVRGDGEYKAFAYKKRVSQNSEELYNELTIEAQVPSGYVAILSSEGKILEFNGGSYKYVTKDGNRKFTLEFVKYGLVGDEQGKHLELIEEVDKKMFGVTGRQELVEVVYNESLKNAFYKEVWTLNAEFGDPNYYFIGWYEQNEAGDYVLAATDKEYTIDALRSEKTYQPRFGHYRIELDNESPLAGKVRGDGYDVTVDFKLNSDLVDVSSVGGVVSSVTLNVGDSITYPKQYLNKQALIDQGYLFLGWYENADGSGEAYDFTQPVKSSLTLYAKWCDLKKEGLNKELVAMTDGTEVSLTTTVATRYVSFYAITSGTYSVYAKCTNTGKKVILTLDGKREQIESISYGQSVEISVEEGKFYNIGLAAVESDYADVVTVKVHGTDPADGGVRYDYMPYGETFRATAVENDGYVFEGFYIDGELIGNRQAVDPEQTYYVYEKFIDIPSESFADLCDENGVIRIETKWAKYTLNLVTNNLDGGTISYKLVEDNANYNGAKVWLLSAYPNKGYEFDGWYYYDEEQNKFDDDNALSVNNEYAYLLLGKNVTVQARWLTVSAVTTYSIIYELNSSDGYNAPENINSFNDTNTTIIKLYDPIRPYVGEDSVGYYKFEGWYTDNYTFINRVESINPKNQNSAMKLYAKWGKPVRDVPVMSDEKGKYILLGNYPQSIVTDANELYNIDSSKPYENNYYKSKDGAKSYKAVTVTERKTYKGNVYEPGVYYFRVEPIRWNIVRTRDGLSLVEADKILIPAAFNTTTNVSGRYYANVWEYSSIRSQLNNDDEFIKECFSTVEQNVLKSYLTAVANGKTSGDDGVSDYEWADQNDTDDYIFLMSFKEKTDYSIGFNRDATSADAKRAAQITDYCFFTGINYQIIDGAYYGAYWLRSPANEHNYAYNVDFKGAIVRNVKVNESSSVGVRPCFTFVIE